MLFLREKAESSRSGIPVMTHWGQRWVTAPWWLRESAHLVLMEGHRSVCNRVLKLKFWESPGFRCLLWSGKYKDEPPLLIRLLGQELFC